MTDRLVDTSRLYELLDRLADRIHGPRLLSDCHGRLGWPHRGVYFFYEGDENRSGSGAGARVVRVGTHALKYGSTSRLWGRLRTHRGPAGSGTGSHRSSIFRLLVGIALAKKNNIPLPTSWDVSGDPCQSCPPTGISRVQLLEEEADLRGSCQQIYRPDALPLAQRRRCTRPRLPARFYRTQRHRALELLQQTRPRPSFHHVAGAIQRPRAGSPLWALEQ